MHRDEGKSRIAILGGGVGSLAAAFDLTEVDPDGELYDITIYQVGWRLGAQSGGHARTTRHPRLRISRSSSSTASTSGPAFTIMRSTCCSVVMLLMTGPTRHISTPLRR